MQRVVMALALAFVTMQLASCSEGLSPECMTSRVDPAYEQFAAILDDGRTSLILGISEKNRDRRTRETVIFRRAHDDRFELLSMRARGSTLAAATSGRYLYFVNEVYPEQQSTAELRATLYRLNTRTEEMDVVSELGSLFAKDIVFDRDSVIYISARFSGFARDAGILATSDGGVTWDTLKLGVPIKKVRSDGARLHVLSQKRNDSTEWIYTIDTKSGDVDSSHFDIDITDFAVGGLGEYWLLGQRDSTTLLVKNVAGTSSVIETFSSDGDYFPQEIFRYQNTIVVFASEIDRDMLAGFGGTRDEVLVSTDDGETWNELFLGEALYAEPVAVHEDQRVTVYTGAGRVVTCTI